MSDDPLSWKDAWKDHAFRRALVVGLLLSAVVAMLLPRFFGWIERRPGLLLDDPVLRVLGPADVSVPTFAVLYGTLVLVVASVVRRPYLLLSGIYAYLVLMVLRMACMTVLTLEPPPGIVVLRDPVTRPFYPGAQPFLKDLFFSGHTATLALMAFLAPVRGLRILAFLGALSIAVCVLVQHAHWTIDVLAAPFAAWIAWKAGARLSRSFGLRVKASASAGA